MTPGATTSMVGGMRFRPGQVLDPSQVEDRRGSGGGSFGSPIALGGGGLGVVGLVVYLAIVLLGGGGNAFSGLEGITVSSPGQSASSVLGTDCRSGADANTRQDCRIVADINSVQSYWEGWFRAHGKRYQLADTVFFSGATGTGCGTATTDVGPFYCPVDKKVYIDLGFYEELKSRFGARGGPFAEAYVIAHEYGHHVQDLLGALEPGSSQGPREPLGTHRAPGRLLRRSLGTARRGDRLHRRPDAAGHRGGARCRLGGRRRPDPGGDAGPGEPRDVDTRIVCGAPGMVPARLPARRAERLRHVQRDVVG